MAMSREIPINVHPEFRRRTTSDQQGKPRIFTRSSSLPCEPKLKLVLETDSDHEQARKPEEKHTTAECSSKGSNATKSTQNYDNFWKSHSPVDSEGRKQRRHFFAENPFVGDLEKVFEDHYTSDLRRPVKLGRRNTYSGWSSRENQHAAQKIGNSSSERNKNETSFDIPVKVEFDLKSKDGVENSGQAHNSESKFRRGFSRENRNETSYNVPVHVEFDELHDGEESQKKNSEETLNFKPNIGQNLSGESRQEMSFDVPVLIEFDDDERKDKELENETFEKDSVQDKERANKQVDSEVDMEQQESEVFKIGEPCTLIFDGSKINNIDKEQVLKNNEDDTAIGMKESEYNIDEEGPVIIEVGEQCSSTLPPQKVTEAENANKEKLFTIQNILKKVEGIEKKVDAFVDKSKTKEYLILEETLTCCLIELDGIERNQDENIRLARKTAVQQLQRTLTRLEKKVSCKEEERKEDDCLE